MEKITEALSSGRNNIKKVLIGSLVSIGITLIGLVIFSILLTYTKIGENTIPTVTIVITGISILIGSTIAMTNVKKSGLLNGAIIGAIYFFTIYLLSSTIEKSFSLNTHSIIMIIACILAGALGGVIGVNKN